MTNVTWTFDSADLKSGDNILTVVFDQTGLEEDYNGQDTFKVCLFSVCLFVWGRGGIYNLM